MGYNLVPEPPANTIPFIFLVQFIIYIEIKHCIFQTCMLQILFAEYRLLHRYAPVYAKAFILDIDAAISLWMIELVALVLEDGGFA